MRVLHLTETNAGGAGLGATRIYQALKDTGFESLMLVNRSAEPGSADTVGFENNSFRIQRFLTKAALKLLAHDRYYFQQQSLGHSRVDDIAAAAKAFAPDVIFAHYLSHFLSFDNVRHISQQCEAPLIISMLDMANMTGGCHFAWDCEGYTRHCGNCPALRISHAGDSSARNHREKTIALRDLDVTVLAGTSQLAEQAAKSALFANHPVHTILLGVPSEQFSPGDRVASRAHFGIGPDGRLLFIGTQKLSQERKGMRELLDALERLPELLPDGVALPHLLVAGHSSQFQKIHDRGYQLHNVGFLSTDDLARAYDAADYFVCPSLEDSGPMMVNESLMTGTPVIAFPVGVSKELVEHQRTGYLANWGDPEALAREISQALSIDDRQYREMSAAARSLALEKCSTAGQMAKLQALVESVASGESAPAANGNRASSNPNVQPLDWDSDFFGFAVGSVELDQPADNCAERLRALPFRLVYIFADPGDTAMSETARTLNIEPVDRRVVFAKALTDTASHPGDLEGGSIEDCLADTSDKEAIRMLALQAGALSRFRIDGKIPPGKFEEMYRAWADNSLDGSYADAVIVRRDTSGKPKGMITVRNHSSHATIGLFAVDSAFRGQGIGSDLLNLAERWALAHNAPELRVITQANNAGACRSYEKAGFSIVERRDIYHLWNTER